MPIFLDLDNTLVDRDEAFIRWARDSVINWGGDEPDIHWLIHADASGYTPRIQVAQIMLRLTSQELVRQVAPRRGSVITDNGPGDSSPHS